MTMGMSSMKGEMINVAAPQVKLASMPCMKGGNGDGSYPNNSHAQALHARRLFIVDVIVRRVAEAYEARGHGASPEFQVFFSDLPSNDFNTLFQLLPPLQAPAAAGSLEECLAAAGEGAATRPYHAAGVPGSFYGRFFPRGSIDVFSSTFSLHWLSQVPDEVTDSGSPAYNAGRVFVHRATAATAAAYRRQFWSDLSRFLQSRARELKRGGAVFLACLGRTAADPADQGGAGLMFGSHLQDAWEDLVQESVVEREKRDSFNVPVYAPSLQDFRDVVRENGASRSTSWSWCGVGATT